MSSRAPFLEFERYYRGSDDMVIRVEQNMTSTTPYRGQNDVSQLMACPRCGALNMLSASYCLNCGEFLPPPVNHPSYRPAVPQPQPSTGLSVPAILLIVSVLLVVVILAFLMIAFAV